MMAAVLLEKVFLMAVWLLEILLNLLDLQKNFIKNKMNDLSCKGMSAKEKNSIYHLCMNINLFKNDGK